MVINITWQIVSNIEIFNLYIIVNIIYALRNHRHETVGVVHEKDRVETAASRSGTRLRWSIIRSVTNFLKVATGHDAQQGRVK